MIFLARQDEELFKQVYKTISDQQRTEPDWLKKSQRRISRSNRPIRIIKTTKSINTKRLKKLGIIEFLELFKYKIVPNLIFSTKNRSVYPIHYKGDEYYLVSNSEKIPKKYRIFIMEDFGKSFNKWKEKIMKSKMQAIEVPKEWAGLPWEQSAFNEYKNIHLARGLNIQEQKAEKYHTMRNFFEWGKYIIVCAPDGIAKDFCYEFKSVNKKFISYYILPVAVNQAMLYSYFFKRPYYRVQIHIQETNEIETIHEKLNMNKVKELLNEVDALLTGHSKLIKPKVFKCTVCEYRKQCEICN